RRLRRGPPLLRRARARRPRGGPRPRPGRAAQGPRAAARARPRARRDGRDAAGRRLPPALPRRELRPRDLLRGDGARARLPGGRARAGARRAPARDGRRHRAHRHQRGALPAARRRLLRVAGRAHPHLPAPRPGRRPARRRARAHRRRLRARLPHALLGAALGGAPARRGPQPARAGLPQLPDQGDHLALARPLREAGAGPHLPEELDPVRAPRRAGRRARVSARPLRLLFTSYRGNMHCGGQGVYLWFLTRELARLGHEITVLVGPPLPDPMPFARAVVEIPDDRFWGKWFVRDWANFFPRENPLAVLTPLRFWELAASRIGFFPEPFAFSV